MFVDHHTLVDLEIFETTDAGEPLAWRLDRTRSRLGSRRWRERLRTPSSDPAILRMWLEGTSFLHGEGLAFPLDGRLLAELERYLGSTYTTVGAGSRLAGVVSAIWTSLRYPDLLALARSGVETMGHLLTQVMPVVATLRAAGPPPAIGVVVDSLGNLAERLQLESLCRRARRSWSVLHADHQLRGRHRADLLRFMDLVAELDVQFSAAALLREGYALPELDEESSAQFIDCTAAWHPLLPEAVRNGLVLGGHKTVAFVTGPNMAGKTTFLRTVGVCAYLAHCGVPVPAKRLRFVPLGALYVTIHPRDDLRTGVSLFLAEILRVRAVLERAKSGVRTLALFDELFRGTHQDDARDASLKVLADVAGASSLILVVSSHLSDLARELEQVPGVKLACFEGGVEGDSMFFDYRLRPGVSHQRLGLELFRRHGLTDLLALFAAERRRPARGGLASGEDHPQGAKHPTEARHQARQEGEAH